MDRQIRYIIIAVLAVIWILFRCPDWLITGPFWLKATTYSFFHASIWHLLVNCIAIWGLFRPGISCKPCRDLILAFIIAVLVFPISLKPIVGFSNILYACIGMRTPELASGWWKRTETITFLVVTVALVFFPQFSALTHIVSFILGMLVASVRRITNNLLKDARRYY